MIAKPKALKMGDRIALVAPSGPVADTDRVNAAARALGQFGFEVTVYKSCYRVCGYLSGSDDERAQDFNDAFADPEVAGVVCLKGGYGTPRILDRLDYGMIAKHPKVFAGYSDITGLHLALHKKCGFPTFHAPMASELTSGVDRFSWDGWLRALTSAEPLGILRNPPGETMHTLVGGRASGPIIGGNLSLVAASLGTPYEIDVRGKLLFLEDVCEEPYSVDRMLTQLRLAGKFEECSGVILGDWHDCLPEEGKPSLSLEQVFNDVIVPAGKPVIGNLKAGHCPHKVTLPLGVEAFLDADNCMVEMRESAVV